MASISITTTNTTACQLSSATMWQCSASDSSSGIRVQLEVALRLLAALQLEVLRVNWQPEYAETL
jgi:hypothetical protein